MQVSIFGFDRFIPRLLVNERLFLQFRPLFDNCFLLRFKMTRFRCFAFACVSFSRACSKICSVFTQDIWSKSLLFLDDRRCQTKDTSFRFLLRLHFYRIKSTFQLIWENVHMCKVTHFDLKISWSKAPIIINQQVWLIKKLFESSLNLHLKCRHNPNRSLPNSWGNRQSPKPHLNLINLQTLHLSRTNWFQWKCDTHL